MALVFVDADTIYFRAACVTQKQNELRKIINNTMDDIKRDCTAILFEEPEILVALKGQGNFRKDLFPQYKAHRPTLEPKVREALNYGHSYMQERYGGVRADGMEADDLVSIWAAEARNMERSHIIAGVDKDLRQIPGDHYNYTRRDHEYVDADAANYNLMLQCLTGDSGDNIPGIKGIGPVKAKRILGNTPSSRRWNRVRAAWRGHSAGSPELSRRLLEMITSWEELDDIKAQLQDQTSKRKQDVLPQQAEQDEGIS